MRLSHLTICIKTDLSVCGENRTTGDDERLDNPGPLWDISDQCLAVRLEYGLTVNVCLCFVLFVFYSFV